MFIYSIRIKASLFFLYVCIFMRESIKRITKANIEKKRKNKSKNEREREENKNNKIKTNKTKN